MSGFGLALPLLDRNPIPKHPWVTVELAEKERAIGERLEDAPAVALDSLDQTDI